MNQVESAISIRKVLPRVFLTGVLKELSYLRDCKVIWPSQFESGIYDFGRSAVSVYFPMRLNLSLTRDDEIKLGFRLGKYAEPFSINCKVYRSETRLLVVSSPYQDINFKKRVIDYFTPEEIAANMHFVDRSNYALEQTFSYWFHGPLDTNVYIWDHNDEIHRILIEYLGSIYDWKSGVLSRGPSRDNLSYSTEDYAFYSHTLAPLQMIDNKSDDVLNIRYFLSCLMSVHPVMKSMVDLIASDKKVQ